MLAPVQVDHVTYVVPDGEAFAERMRDEHGLASFPGGHLPHLGARSFSAPIEPPSYVEWLQVDDRAVASRSETGRRALEVLDRGGGLVAWTVRVPDIAAASRRVGIDVFEGATTVVGGAVRRWWTVTRDLDLPVLIAYDDPEPGARLARWRAAYDGIGHTSAPGGFTRIEVGGSPEDLAAWLGPHDLPVAFVEGPPGIRAAHVATANGAVVLT